MECGSGGVVVDPDPDLDLEPPAPKDLAQTVSFAIATCNERSELIGVQEKKEENGQAAAGNLTKFYASQRH